MEIYFYWFNFSYPASFLLQSTDILSIFEFKVFEFPFSVGLGEVS